MTPKPLHDASLMPDFSRHAGLLDTSILTPFRISTAGVGGAAGLISDLVRCGIPNHVIIDPDIVGQTNLTTQQYDSWDIGEPKVFAERDRLLRINPDVDAIAIAKRYQDLTKDQLAIFWAGDLVLAMTDDFYTQDLIHKDALRYKRDTLFAICGIGGDVVEVTADFPETIAAGLGCHRCHNWPRYQAYEQEGFRNPSTIASHAVTASYLNAIIAHIVLARLHQKVGSDLPITALAHAFAETPFLQAHITPQFALTPDMQRGPLIAQPFRSRLYELDCLTTCPDCGSVGLNERSPQTTNQERSGPCVDQLSPAASVK